MANGEASKGARPKPVPNKHLHSRISYLYQAAAYLSTQSLPGAGHVDSGAAVTDAAFPPGLPYFYISHLQSISRKAQVHLSQHMKNSICKRCNTLLVAGSTSSHKVENLSRGQKPWADILVIECNVCGAQKRFPVGATRQPRKKDRAQIQEYDSSEKKNSM